MNGACVSLVYYATINFKDKNYKPKLYKESCKTSFKKHAVTAKNRLTYHCTLTNMTQAINRLLELKNEATAPTDILEIKRNIQVL